MDRGSQWRRIPGVLADALRLVWAASPRLMLTTTLLQFFGATVLGAQLLVGKQLLQDLIAVSEDGRSAASLLPAFLLLIGATIIAGVITALTANHQRQLSELVGRYTFDRIIEVSAAVPLDAFETPAFYDQLARAKAPGMTQPIEMVNSVTAADDRVRDQPGRRRFVLATIEPLLLPVAVLAGIPLLARGSTTAVRPTSSSTR